MGFVGYVSSAVALIVLGLLPQRRIGRAAATAGAALILIFVASISGSVFSADAYVGDGSSNWSNRGLSAHAIYAVAMATAAVVAGLLASLGVRNARPAALSRVLLVSGFGCFVIGYVVLFAFGNN